MLWTDRRTDARHNFIESGLALVKAPKHIITISHIQQKCTSRYRLESRLAYRTRVYPHGALPDLLDALPDNILRVDRPRAQAFCPTLIFCLIPTYTRQTTRSSSPFSFPSSLTSSLHVPSVPCPDVQSTPYRHSAWSDLFFLHVCCFIFVSICQAEPT